MQTTQSPIAFLALLAGFLLLLSKIPFLVVPGVLLIVAGIFTPFYKDPLQKGIHRIRSRISEQNGLRIKAGRNKETASDPTLPHASPTQTIMSDSGTQVVPLGTGRDPSSGSEVDQPAEVSTEHKKAEEAKPKIEDEEEKNRVSEQEELLRDLLYLASSRELNPIVLDLLASVVLNDVINRKDIAELLTIKMHEPVEEARAVEAVEAARNRLRKRIRTTQERLAEDREKASPEQKNADVAPVSETKDEQDLRA